MISEFGITADVSDSDSSQPASQAQAQPQSETPPQQSAAPQQQQQQVPPAQEQQYADPYQQVPPMQGQPYADPYQQPYPGMYPPYPYPPQYYAPPNQPRMINVQNMTGQFDNVTQLTKAEEGNLDLIMSVPLQISVEIGRTKKQVKDILSLSQGSLVVLDKLAGEQVDIFVNGQHVAKGDVVVVDDNFGVRITEIIKDPEQLIRGNQNG
jgi:flagellar motor switch protein FliN/FliY